MNWYDVLGWAATVAVLAAYGWRKGAWFDQANAALWIVVALPAVVRGAWNSVAISATFGVIGTYATVRRYRSSATDQEVS